MPKNDQYSADDLDELTEEERAALEEFEDDTDDGEPDPAGDGDSGEAEAGDKAEAEAEKADDKAGDKAADAEAEAEKANGEAEKAADAADDEAEAEAEAETKGPKPTFVPPEGLQERLDAVEAKLDDYASKFDEGEITAAEYNTARRELAKEEREISSQMIRAEVSTDLQMAAWKDTCSDFIGNHTMYENPALLSALDTEVRRLQSESDNGYDPAHLTKAHENLMSAINGGKKENAAPSPGKRQPEQGQGLGDVPPNLAHTPASDTNDEGGGSKFDLLDKLADGEDVEQYEAALSRLSESERNAYLQHSS